MIMPYKRFYDRAVAVTLLCISASFTRKGTDRVFLLPQVKYCTYC